MIVAFPLTRVRDKPGELEEASICSILEYMGGLPQRYLKRLENRSEGVQPLSTLFQLVRHSAMTMGSISLFRYGHAMRMLDMSIYKYAVELANAVYHT